MDNQDSQQTQDSQSFFYLFKLTTLKDKHRRERDPATHVSTAHSPCGIAHWRGERDWHACSRRTSLTASLTPRPQYSGPHMPRALSRAAITPPSAATFRRHDPSLSVYLVAVGLCSVVLGRHPGALAGRVDRAARDLGADHRLVLRTARLRVIHSHLLELHEQPTLYIRNLGGSI